MIRNFIAEKDGEGEVDDGNSQNEDEKNPEPRSAIGTLSEAIKLANELQLFAAENGLHSVLNDVMPAEGKLQQAYVQLLKTSGHQTCIDTFFSVF